MTTPPVIITPNGAGEATQSAQFTITATTAASCLVGDIMIVGVACDGAQAAISVVAANFAAFKMIWNGNVGGSGVLAVTASLWAGLCIAPIVHPFIEATCNSAFDDCGLLFAVTRGSNIFSVFDPNLLLPASTVGTTVTFDTDNPDDLALFFNFGHSGMWIGPPPDVLGPSDWSFVTSYGNSGGFGFIGGSLYQRTFTTPQVGAIAQPLITIVGNTLFVVIALTANPPASGAGYPVTINAPPPQVLVCVPPCETRFDPTSHAWGAWCGAMPG